MQWGEEAPNYTSSHCVLRHHALSGEEVPIALTNTLDEAVKINFIKFQLWVTLLPNILCDEMVRSHKALWLSTKVRWLSQGKHMGDRVAS